MTALQDIVRQFDPLLKSLIGGQDIHRAAVWGQVLQESAADPAAVSTDGGHGLWQHTGSRWTELASFAASRGTSWKDIATQVRFTAKECTSSEEHAWLQTQKTTTPEAATETFMLDFERPATQGGPPTYGTARLDIRIKGAKQALAVIQAAQPGESKVTDTPAPATTIPATVAPTANGIAEALEQFMPAVEQRLFEMERKLAQQQGGLFPILEPLMEKLEDKLIQLAADEIKQKLSQFDINSLLPQLLSHVLGGGAAPKA